MAGLYEWTELEFQLYNSALGHSPNAFDDAWTQTLYDTALFNHDITGDERAAVLDALRDRMWDEYGIDFDTVFDWESYREAYDSGGV